MSKEAANWWRVAARSSPTSVIGRIARTVERMTLRESVVASRARSTSARAFAGSRSIMRAE